MLGTIVESTVLILVLGLILAHANAFSTAIRAVGQVYTSAVQTLAAVGGTAN